MNKLDNLKIEIKNKFPNVWVKNGGDFDSRHDGTLWTGEGSVMPDGLEAFNQYDIKEINYQMGIHKELVKVLDAHGFYAEAHDGGTYFIREI